MKFWNTYIKLLTAGSLTLASCSDLEPEVFDQIDGDVVVEDAAEELMADNSLVEAYLSTSYNQLYQFLDEREIYSLTEVTTDEMVVPTRVSIGQIMDFGYSYISTAGILIMSLFNQRGMGYPEG